MKIRALPDAGAGITAVVVALLIVVEMAVALQ
jgi:hypothetical protein